MKTTVPMTMIHKQKTQLYFKLIDVLKYQYIKIFNYINFNATMVTEHKIVKLQFEWKNPFG